jgi:hypothetical protein
MQRRKMFVVLRLVKKGGVPPQFFILGYRSIIYCGMVRSTVIVNEGDLLYKYFLHH